MKRVAPRFLFPSLVLLAAAATVPVADFLGSGRSQVNDGDTLQDRHGSGFVAKRGPKGLLVVAIILCVTASYASHMNAGAITNIDTFLDMCPTADPLYNQLRADFKIRRDGVLVGAINCSGPISSLPASQYTDELLALQTFRTAYYMDLGQSGHLPWTPGTLYAWMKSKVAGVDFNSTSANSYCCTTYAGERYIEITPKMSSNVAANLFYLTWPGISGGIGLFAHEIRHVDGPGHVSCCGRENGCDQSYDPSNISSYGVQWYLNSAWLAGTINVGLGCLSAQHKQDYAYEHLYLCNEVFRNEFCTNPPPLLTAPAEPGGPCALCTPDATTLCLNGGRFEARSTWMTTDGDSGPGMAVPLTGDTGYFWFFSSNNVEMVVKVVSGCDFNSRLWTFAGGLTNVKVVMTVRDTVTGVVKTYTNQQGTAFQPIQDANAFAACSMATEAGQSYAPGAASARRSESDPERLTQDLTERLASAAVASTTEAVAACTTDATTLCLNNNRFKVQTRWTTAQGQTGAGQAVSLTGDTGYFWFFSANNVEMVVKALSACTFNSRFWVFAGGLTNVNVVTTVTDTQTGNVKTYTNPQGTAFQPIQDTSAFVCP